MISIYTLYVINIESDILAKYHKKLKRKKITIDELYNINDFKYIVRGFILHLHDGAPSSCHAPCLFHAWRYRVRSRHPRIFVFHFSFKLARPWAISLLLISTNDRHFRKEVWRVDVCLTDRFALPLPACLPCALNLFLCTLKVESSFEDSETE